MPVIYSDQADLSRGVTQQLARDIAHRAALRAIEFGYQHRIRVAAAALLYPGLIESIAPGLGKVRVEVEARIPVAGPGYGSQRRNILRPREPYHALCALNSGRDCRQSPIAAPRPPTPDARPPTPNQRHTNIHQG